MAYKEAKPLSHDLSEEDSRHHTAKTHLWHRSLNSGFFPACTPSWCNHGFVGSVILSAWKITTTRRNCSTANWLRESAPKEARKSASKTWNLSVLPLVAKNIWHRTETSGVKLSNVEQKSVKPATELRRKFRKKHCYICHCRHHSLFSLPKTLPRTE